MFQRLKNELILLVIVMSMSVTEGLEKSVYVIKLTLKRDISAHDSSKLDINGTSDGLTKSFLHYAKTINFCV